MNKHFQKKQCYFTRANKNNKKNCWRLRIVIISGSGDILTNHTCPIDLRRANIALPSDLNVSLQLSYDPHYEQLE